ncbi:MAG: DUF3368 domain-containing protein [Ignavibacteriales bacterium]|nr:DUF3368 domain-containing protein [Ignavibacteriales bacterium]
MKDPTLVLDTSICVDLSNGKLLEIALQLHYTFLLPDVIAGELMDPQGEDLLKIGYKVINLAPEQIGYIEILNQKYSQPSRADLFALASAKYLSCILLTGDQSLRKAADTESVEVHGILWLLDKLVFGKLITADFASHSLNNIIESGSWLPKKEIETRLKKWKK